MTGREAAAAFRYRVLLAWERRKLAVSETLLGGRIALAKLISPRGALTRRVVAERSLDDAIKWLRSALDYIDHGRTYDTKFACLDPWAFSQVCRLEDDAAAVVAAYDRETTA